MRIGLFIATGLLCLFFTCSLFFLSTQRELKTSINLSMQYIKNHTLPNGRFLYQTNLDSSKKYSKNEKYNILRHAGTIYSMILCEKYLKDTSLKEQRYLASEYLIKNYVRQISPDTYAVISNPREENKNYECAKLGATGLALMGLSSLYPEGKIDLKILEGLGNFLIFMQNEDGSYISIFNVSENKKESTFNSLYYPGEAAYGLLFLNEVYPQDKWIQSAKKALLYLAKCSEKRTSKVPFDHWAMLAMKKLFETPNNTLTEDEKIKLQKFAEKVAYSLLDKQITDKKNPYYGAFESNIRLGSIGTIMEGYIAIYYITNDRELREQIKQLLERGTLFLSKYQVKTGRCIGGLPANAYWVNSDAQAKDKKIRIDNVQHVMSAWITYLELLKN